MTVALRLSQKFRLFTSRGKVVGGSYI